jgi:NADPH-dependent F420 reductase
MATKKTIAIIGASGNMGSAIAKSLATSQYRLLLFGKEENKLKTILKEIRTVNNSLDAEIIGCAADASWEADIIIAAVPFAAEKELAEKIRQVATGKIVISISNPLNETYTGLVTDGNTSSAEELQKLLPHSKVIKAFNTTFAGDFSQPLIDGKTVDAFIAGNDDEALETVSDVVRSAGFNPIKAGGLAISRTLENMQALLIQLNMKNNYNWVAGWKILHN